MSVNNVQILGHLGQTPTLRHTSTDLPVTNLSVATNERRGDSEHTEWHAAVVFGKTAENCAEYLTKGRQVYVEGRLQTRSYEDSEGITRRVTEIVADKVVFVDRPRKTEDVPF